MWRDINILRFTKYALNLRITDHQMSKVALQQLQIPTGLKLPIVIFVQC